jgi:hypothetical protein
VASGSEAGESTEVYGYDALNRLTSTVRDGALVDSRGYDGANRVVSSGPGAVGVDYINLHRQWRGTTGNDALQGRQNLYDANGQLVHQKTLEYLVAGSAVNYEYDAAGNVLGYLVADTVNNTFTHTANTVVRAEGYRTAMSFSATTAAATGALLSQGGLGYGYDANGHLNFTGDSGQMSQPTLRTHNFVNDASGNALYAYYAYEGAPQTQANQVNGQRQLIVNGEVLGRYGLMADHRFEGTPLAQNGPFFTPQSDFSFGYQPIDGNYPSGSPGTYAVGAGDTLQSIAKGAYGDASLWYLIADANGLSSNADLRTGHWERDHSDSRRKFADSGHCGGDGSAAELQLEECRGQRSWRRRRCCGGRCIGDERSGLRGPELWRTVRQTACEWTGRWCCYGCDARWAHQRDAGRS